MISVHLSLISLLICLQNVFINCRENILLQGRYNFNHPPSVEEYNPLPIIINYNEEDVTVGKATIGPNNYESEMELITDPAEELLPPAPPKLEISDISQKKTGGELKVEGRTLNEQKIPVTVIYESAEKLHSEIKPKLTGTSQSLGIQKGPTNRQQKQLSLKESEKYNQESKTDVLQSDANISPSKKKNRQRDPIIPILESENFLYAYRGDYHYGYESGDGTKAFGKGKLKTFSDNSTGEAVEGSFSYKDNEGNSFSLTYTADENGYRPVGAHLPTPPPLPPAIERALRYLATKKPDSVTEKL